ncbi:hypothetical protein H2274_07205 [Campylobacter sp. W0049]|uniref:hypothetical protein n=1 Tax=Campylobacter molothri TaxID=1032242 RepID=UPI00301BC711|nr:hypothetical protein [Campylobacter sp. W0049]
MLEQNNSIELIIKNDIDNELKKSNIDQNYFLANRKIQKEILDNVFKKNKINKNKFFYKFMKNHFFDFLEYIKESNFRLKILKEFIFSIVFGTFFIFFLGFSFFFLNPDDFIYRLCISLFFLIISFFGIKGNFEALSIFAKSFFIEKVFLQK